MISVDLVGYSAGIIILISFILQIRTLLIKKCASSLSKGFIVSTIIVAILYIIYGYLIKATPIIVINLIAGLLAVVMFIIKVYYDEC